MTGFKRSLSQAMNSLGTGMRRREGKEYSNFFSHV